MISSRFGQSRKDVEPEPEASLNNVTEELRKSSRSIDEEEAKKKDGIYGKPRAQDPPLNMQQYPKNACSKYYFVDQLRFRGFSEREKLSFSST